MSLQLCQHCGQHYLDSDPECPHCPSAVRGSATARGPSSHALKLSVLLGLGLQSTVTACIGDKYGMADDSWDSTVTDMDSDGYDSYEDCDDSNGNVYWNAAPNEATEDCYEDADGDGYGAQEPTSAAAASGTDCDDTDAEIHPAAKETPGDGVDANCDGSDDK